MKRGEECRLTLTAPSAAFSKQAVKKAMLVSDITFLLADESVALEVGAEDFAMFSRRLLIRSLVSMIRHENNRGRKTDLRVVV